MSLRRPILTAVLGLTALLWGDDRGIRPRPTPDDYPARQTIDGVTLAAAVLTPEQVKKRFATDLNHGYIVVEVAVYPQPGRDIDMAARDFLARYGAESDTQRPLSAQAIAARLGKKDTVPSSSSSDLSKVHVYTAETIGVVHDANGRTGVYTGTTTGVGVGNTPGPPPPPPSSSSGGLTHEAVRQELESMALPERRIAEEVAGYLYLAKPSKAKSTPLHLTYYGAQDKVELAVPMK